MADDPKIAENEKREAGREAAAIERATKQIMETSDGRQWMWELMAFCRPHQDRYLFDGDAYGAMKRDGMASVGNHLMTLIEQHCVERYVDMLKEHQARLKRKQEREALKGADPENEITLTTTIERLAEVQAEKARAEEAQQKNRKP